MTYLVHAAGHVQINVTDMNTVVRHATEILGLLVTHATDSETWLSSNGRAAELVLHRADRNAVRVIGCEVLSADGVREAQSRVESAGCRVLSTRPSLACVNTSVTFVTPEGLVFEFHTPVQDNINRRRYATSGIAPSRLDHMNILSPDPVATRTQLERIGGMKLSERMVNDGLSWMHGGNRQHHIFGVVRGSTGLHHYSFEVQDFTSYMKLGDILDRHDKQLVWGPGRHRPGDNTYAYYVDASGCMVECSGPMSQIADDANYVPNVITNLERPGNVRVMNVWGTPAPKDWLEHQFPFAAITS